VAPRSRRFIKVVCNSIKRRTRAGLVTVRIEELRKPLDVNLAKRYVGERVRHVPSHANRDGNCQLAAVVRLQPDCKLIPELNERIALEADGPGSGQLASEHFGEPRVERAPGVLVVGAHVERGEHRESEEAGPEGHVVRGRRLQSTKPVRARQNATLVHARDGCNEIGLRLLGRPASLTCFFESYRECPRSDGEQDGALTGVR
jgi:hypothetical protein